VIKRFLDRFRKQKTSLPIDVKTAPLSEEKLDQLGDQQIRFAPPQFLIGTAQSVGMERDHNEDTLFTFYGSIADGNRDLYLGVFVIADGMGGHMNGEVASGAAARAMGQYIVSNLYGPVLGVDPRMPEKSLLELAEDGVLAAHQSVVRQAPGGGTTLTAVVLLGEQMTLAHVGDSRAYQVLPGHLPEVLTHDHSLAHRLQELGQITAEEASNHPQRNVLYRALGQAEPFHPDVHSHPVPTTGSILLCSDGLWGVLPPERIAEIIAANPNPSVACHRLVQAANAAGGPDNISAILVTRL
jgi:serine/threonine protein phosphatase PrpC